MTDRHPGLRKRLELEARRISSQHRQLDELYALLCAAQLEQDPAAFGEAFQRFRAALDAHFLVEERTHFPAIHGMDPLTEAELEELVGEHVDFGKRLAGIQQLLEAGDRQGSADALAVLVEKLILHEQNEEQLFARTTGGAPPAENPIG